MGDDYQLRKDIDELQTKFNKLNRSDGGGLTEEEVINLINETRPSGGGSGGDLSGYSVDFNYSWGNPLLDDDSITLDIFLKEE